MKKRGGPAALKTFWENIRTRTTAYNQIIDNQILEILQVEINNIRRKKVHLTK